MTIGELFKNRENWPSVEDILNREIKFARGSFPDSKLTDEQRLALCTSALRKNLAERTEERDKYFYERLYPSKSAASS